MAFSPLSLSRISKQVPVGSAAGLPQAQQVARWLYTTDDAAATVETAGYFNAASAKLKKGDIIEASMVNSGAPVGKNYIVTANAAGVVTIAVFS